MKKYLFGMTVLLVAFSLFAFTKQTEYKKPFVEEKWFLFNGSPGQENDATKYSLMSPQPSTPPCLSSAPYRCAIKIEPNASNQPDFVYNSASDIQYRQTP